MNLREGDKVVGAGVVTDQDEVLIITEKGYGKRTIFKIQPKAVAVRNQDSQYHREKWSL